MPKTVSVAEAKERFEELAAWAISHDEPIIVEPTNGGDRVMIATVPAAVDAEQRRQEAFDRLFALQQRVSAANQDLTEEQAMELADRFVHEVFEEMADERPQDFERTRQRRSSR